MKRLGNPKSMKLLEIIISLIAIGVFIAAVIFTFIYAPGMTIVDVKYGFRFGFIDYFRGKHLAVINMSPTARDVSADILVTEKIGEGFSQITV